MDDTILLQELEALARDLEVDLRYDEIEGRGGLCHYGGKAHLIISRDLALPERIHLLHLLLLLLLLLLLVVLMLLLVP